MLKFLDYPVDQLPARYRESIELAYQIWECWMTERVPSRPLNHGHRRAASTRISHPLTTPSSLSSSSSTSSSDSCSDSPSTTSPIGTPEFPQYCPEELFGRCYNNPRRDPPVPVSQMVLLYDRLVTEPSDRTTVSNPYSRIGTPPPGERIWWPDERLDPSCMDYEMRGMVYKRDDKQVLVNYGDMITFSDPDGRSYTPQDHSVHERINKSPVKTKKPKRARIDNRKGCSSLQTPYVRMLGETNGRRTVQAWARALRRYKPGSGRIDANLKKYRAEICRPPPESPPWTWQPGSLSAWPKWALKKRAEVLVAMFCDKEPLLWKRASP